MLDKVIDNNNLMKEWNWEKNTIYNPEKLSLGSKKRVWWKCEKGHEWEHSINDRNRGDNCPFCSNKKVLKGYNDLITTDPEIVKEWNYNKNNNLLPSDFVRGSAKKVWWKCKKGHEWQAIIYTRTKQKSSCPYCCNQKILSGYNDLATKNPELAKEWNYAKNNSLLPSHIAPNTNKKVWWKCEKGHEWQAGISERNRGDNCPYCSGHKVLEGYNDLATQNPELAKEWNYKKNNNLKPQNVTNNSGKKVWWKCEKGHEWQAQIASRNLGNGCPKCANENQTSYPEKIIFYYISKVYKNTIENYKPDWLKPMELDIFIPDRNIAIEYDGRKWHKNSQNDNKKNELCKKHNVKLYRLREDGCAIINDLSMNYILKNIKADGSQVIDGLEWLSKQLGINIDVDISRDYTEINNLINFHKKKKSLITPKLIEEWNYEKNGNLNPSNVTNNSGKKVWWKCEKGHEWQAGINDRQRGDSCPYCSGHKVLEGFNDIFSTHPFLINEWDFKKNQDNPRKLSKGSAKKVWWICEKGHSYQQTINSKTQGCGCSVCNGKTILKGYNDLATKNPELVKEWNYERNINVNPDNVAPSSNKKVWWKCEKGHEWYSSIATRNAGNNCPYCSNHTVLTGYNDLATKNPELAKEWNYVKNINLEPTQFLPTAKIIVWWKCLKCGEEYEKSIFNRVRSPKCPKCRK